MELLIKLLADGLMIPIILIAAYALLFKVPHSNRYDTYARIVMAGISSYLIAKLVGAVWQPEAVRPFEKLGLEAGAAFLNNPGFPSDHMLFAAFLALAVWFATRNKQITMVLVVLSLLVAIGRVLAHVHTPLDVVGGVFFAALGALWYVRRDNLNLQKYIAKKAKK